ncbi:MAG TPA: O-antigen ligase family protein [Segeticoccus sp.]|uniref:O-antigen ligase family protein n=1 Tax=Segeticoccus sp. TaxID=2706531 RepID=UPI002D80B57F|nr:O-antigen ligase family protein [Segeticoccus sp.]HET8599498.1 O-antigen ligase family protein [Segeticoccus sp.]
MLYRPRTEPPGGPPVPLPVVLPGTALVVAGTATAVLCGLVEPRAAALGVAGLLGLAALVTAVLRPWAAVVLLVVSEVANLSSILGYVHGLSIYVVLLVAGTASLVLAWRRGRIRLQWSPIHLLVGVYLACQVPSLFGALDPALGFETLVERIKDAVFLSLVTLLLTAVPSGARSTAAVARALGRRQVDLVRVAALVMGGLAVLSVVHEYLLHDAGSLFGLSNVPKSADLGSVTSRHSGPETDPNFWARSLLAFLPLAWSLGAAGHPLAARLPRWSRLGWAVLTLFMAVAVFLTGSRGGFLAAALAGVFWLAVAGRHYRRWLLAVPVLGAGALLLPGLGSRLLTLGQVVSASETSTGDASLVQRAAAQEIGLAMVRDHPALGVGLGNFPVAWDTYQIDATTAVLRQVAPHNLYLQAAAEGGALGLLGLLVLLGGSLALGARALLCTTDGGSARGSRLLSAGLLAALLGWSVASLVLHLGYLRVLFVVMALVAGQDLAERARVRVDVPDRRLLPAPAPRTGRGLVPWVAGSLVALVVCGAGWSLGLTRVSAWTATEQAVLVPVEDEGNPSAYSYGLLARSYLVPTYAVLVQSARDEVLAHDDRDGGTPVAVSASGTAGRALVTVQSTGASPAQAVRVTTRVVAHGREVVARTDGLYRLGASLSPAAATRVSVLDPWRAAALLGAGLLAGAGTVLLARRRLR